MATIVNIPGMETVLGWFEEWPSFHDAEIVSARIERDTQSSLRIRTWISTDRVDSRGQFVREREAGTVVRGALVRPAFDECRMRTVGCYDAVMSSKDIRLAVHLFILEIVELYDRSSNKSMRVDPLCLARCRGDAR